MSGGRAAEHSARATTELHAAVLSERDHSRQLDAQCRASSAPLRDFLDAPTALAACCGFDLCHKYILYLYLYLYLLPHHRILGWLLKRVAHTHTT